MKYTISEVASKVNITVSALRFYDKEGLLPFVDRVNGRRVFSDEDLSWLQVINCLKNTGMPIRNIKEYIDLCHEGDDKLEERQAIILSQKKAIEEQIQFLNKNLEFINYKAQYYEEAIKHGTEAVHTKHQCNPSFKEVDSNEYVHIK